MLTPRTVHSPVFFIVVGIAALSPHAAFALSATSTQASAQPVLLEGLEQRFLEVVAQIDQVASKVDLVKDAALGGAIARGSTLIVHKNDVSTGLILESATYSLDGAVLFDMARKPAALEADMFEVFNGPLEPGAHDISVSLVYRGGSKGLFTYLEGYRFKVESRYRLVVKEGRLNKLDVTAHLKDDMTKELKDRLAVRYDLSVGSVRSVGPASGPPPDAKRSTTQSP